MMSDTIKKMPQINILFIFIILNFLGCQKEGNIKAKVYKNGNVTEYMGLIYSTKYGGLNYYIPNKQQREKLYCVEKIDSVIFSIAVKEYSAKPLVLKAFSRDRNNSDFSYFINKDNYRIFQDTINNLNTFRIFSERTNLEVLKEEGLINAKYLEDK